MSKSHFEHLSGLVDGLAEERILDVGSGKGSFLIEAARAGARATGIEKSREYISISLRRAQEENVSIDVSEGVAESLPFPNDSFEFVNACEVLEHVEDPVRLLKETFRVLTPGGHAYVSVPNRFGLRDQHFHLYFVNWLPRSFADSFISLFGTHKDYRDRGIGRQRLADMHYYTFASVSRLARRIGLSVEDIRLLRIQKEMHGACRLLALFAYWLLRPWYFDSFHLLLTKPQAEKS